MGVSKKTDELGVGVSKEMDRLGVGAAPKERELDIGEELAKLSHAGGRRTISRTVA